MDKQLLDRIVKQLLPLSELNEADTRRAFVEGALYGSPVVNRIDWDGSPNLFTMRLVDSLYKYGDVSPGVNALVAFLSEVKRHVGIDRQEQIDNLIEEMTPNAKTQEPGEVLLIRETQVAQPVSSLVFISYTRKDVDFAIRVRDRLQAAGHRTWMDIYDIPAGAVWPEEIDKALDQASAIIGIMSPTSVQSQNVRNEWSWALVYKVRLILLYLEECRIPHRFIELNFIDFRHDPEAKFRQLESELSKPFAPIYTSPDSKKPLANVTSISTAEIKDTQGISTAFSDTGAKPVQDEIISDSDLRNRSRMLEKVHNFWIKGVLESSLHGAALIDLGIAEMRDAVNHPWNTLLRHDAYAENIQVGTGIASLFDRMSGELLILGQPGSGKTTMLLDLGRKLIEYAQEDQSQPIPVVLNLSSWADERKSITAWVADELNTKYQVPRKVGETWVENDKLLLLLDGLDEVNIRYRNECVSAINSYREKHGLTKLAICSRIAEHDALTERFNLQGAVIIQPLSATQIDAYLTSFGITMAGVRQAINQDKELRELAETPLMLSIMTLAYHGIPADKLIGEKSTEDKRNELFTAYVERMFERRLGRERYSKPDTIHYLSFLAHRLLISSQIVFLIERIQPSWLSSSNAIRAFNITIRALPTIVGFLVILLIHATLGGLPLGGLVGVVVGFVGNWIAYQSFKLSETESKSNWVAELIRTVTNTKELDYEMKVAIISGLIGGPLGGLLGGIANIPVYTSVSSFAVDVLATGMIGGFGAGIVAVLVSYVLGISNTPEQNEVRPIESLTWTLRDAVEQISHVIFPLIIIAVALAVLGFAIQRPEVGVLAGITGISFISAVVGIIGGLRGTEVEEKTRVNQGIWQSLRYSLLGTLIGFVFAVIVGIPGAFIVGWQTTLVISAFVGTIAGLGYGFVYGSSAVLKHMVLRLLLVENGNMPLNYSKFLDYSVSLVLLRKVGGSYIFIHRMLLEYFASLHNSSEINKR